MRSQQVRSALRCVCTHNPFYLISTLLILYGLRSAFGNGLYADSWALIGTLVGFSVLLATTAFWVVRAGGVWDDARSIMLILVLMFFAISISFDHVCASSSTTAGRVLCIGLAFSVVISEGLQRGLRMKLPIAYRASFYAILSLLFLYPLVFSPALIERGPLSGRGYVLLFPYLGAACFLLLIPAIRQGSAVFAKNGTPWRWPWYPWPLFAFLAFGIAVRTYVLELSFLPDKGWVSGFDAYFLLPLWFALICVLLEIGMVERRVAVTRTALLLAPLALLFANPWSHGSAHAQFLALFMDTVGSPIWIAGVSLVAFYAIAWYRHVRHARLGLSMSLLVLSVISPGTPSLLPLAAMQGWPLMCLGCVQLIIAFREHASRRCFSALVLMHVAACLIGANSMSRGTLAVVACHGMLVTVLLLGAAFRDAFSRVLLRWGAYLLAASAACSLVVLASFPQYRLGMTMYPLLAVVIGLAYWYQFGVRPHLYASGVGLSCWIVATGAVAIQPMQQSLGSGAAYTLVAGGICFVVATSTSAYKGGLLRRTLRFGRRIVLAVEAART